LEDRFKWLVEERANGRRPKRYLFDLRNDENERQHVASRYPEEARRLEVELDAWRERHPSDAISLPDGPPEGFEPPADWSLASKPS
jgi:hypothetical protein